MSVDGIVRNGLIVPEQPLHLPDGTRVRIEAVTPAPFANPRQGGQWRGKVQMAGDFDELPDDVARAFGMDDA